MSIEPAILSDLPQLLDLWKKQYDYHYSLDTIYYVPYSEELRHTFESYVTQAITNGTTQILVAKEAEKLIGFITFEEQTEEYFDTQIKKFGVVIEIYVEEELRHRGVGKALMTTAEEYFASRGIGDMRLSSSTFNVESLKFYDTLGYINRQTYLFKKL